MTSVSTQEVLTESISSVRSGPLYDSDVFESTFSSETCTLDRLSDSHTNPASPLHSSTTSLINKTNTPNEDDTYEARTPPSCIDPADEQYSSPAKVFVNRKLEVLRVKLETLTETSSTKNASDSTVQALIQTDTSLQYSWQKAEKTYTEACLERLNLSERPSVNQSRSTQNTIVCTTKPFIIQYERLKMESLQHMMEMQIKRLTDETDGHYQAFTCAECRNQQHDKAEKEFVCQKLKLLTQTEFKEKLDKHLYQMDSLGLLGAIVGSCMKPSAPDGDVWKAMADKMSQLKKETQDN